MRNFNIPPVLLQFAVHHRDERNIILHMMCLPLLLLAVTFLFNSALAPWTQSTVNLLYWSLLGIITLGYVAFAGLLGLTSSIVIIMICTAGHMVSQWGSSFVTFFTGFILLILSYTLHRLGHWYEGNYKTLPCTFSFIAAAPLYITARGLQQHLYFRKICASLDKQGGPIYVRDMINQSCCK